MTALAAYESGLRLGSGCWSDSEGVGRVELPLRRWLDPADACDQALLDRCYGPTLDVGCGPGRLTVHLLSRGIDALGIDVSAEAVRIARGRGARVLRRDVFGTIPHSGAWRHVLLADGNIGIGGSPVALLRRARELIEASGSVWVEVEPRGIGVRQLNVRLEAHGHCGWTPWAQVGVDAIETVASSARLRKVRVLTTSAQRYFVELVPLAAPKGRQ